MGFLTLFRGAVHSECRIFFILSVELFVAKLSGVIAERGTSNQQSPRFTVKTNPLYGQCYTGLLKRVRILYGFY